MLGCLGKKNKKRKDKRVENLIVRKRKLEEIVDGRYEAREGSKKQILEINSEIRSVIINRQDKEEEAAVKNIKTDSKEFFRYAKKHKELRSKIGPLKLDDGLGYQRGPKKMAEILGRQFESVFSTPKVDFTDLILPSYDIEELCDIEITEEELRSAIKSMSGSSAPGPDGIPAYLYKEHVDELIFPLIVENYLKV